MNYKTSKSIISKLVKVVEELEEDFATEGAHTLYEMEEDKTKELLYLSESQRQIVIEAKEFLKTGE